ncbi:MAG: cytochrome P450, partial [Thermoproteota archaeon]|nr:cytochrome P450 [Thermoproteota archaeon]
TGGEGVNVSAEKVKDYLTISSIGVILIGISFSTSALQQTYGVAAHSLVLLASYLFTVGLYSSAIAVSQDSSLRTSIRASLLELVDNIGTAQMVQEIEKRVLRVAREQQEVLRERSGIESSLTEKDMKEYLEQVIKEVKKEGPTS